MRVVPSSQRRRQSAKMGHMNSFGAGAPANTTARELEAALQRSGFYPRLVADVVNDALDGQESLSHLVHLETHFERNEVHRHITVLALTSEMLVITHVDDHQLDESGEQMVAQVSTESVPVSQIKSVVLSYIYAQPQDYKPSDPARELTLAIAWSGGQRIEMGPSACGDPECDADHGYSGTIAQEDIALRISAEAEGLQAVADAKAFARALRAVNTGAVNSGAGHGELAASKFPVFGARLGRSHYRR